MSDKREVLLNWRSWEQALYRWYYALPLLSYQHKRRLVTFTHHHLAFLTRYTESYRHFQRRQAATGPVHETEPGFDNSRDYQAWFRRYVQANPRRFKRLAPRFAALETRTITVLLPVSADQAAAFVASADSVRSQWYPHWELIVLMRDPGLIPVVGYWLSRNAGDGRIQTPIAWSDGLAESVLLSDRVRSDYLAVLEPGTLLNETALVHVAASLDAAPALVYTDEDRIGEHRRHYDPYFKPDWNPDLALAQNLVGGFCVLHRDALRAALAREEGKLPGIHDLSLRVEELVEEERILHIPRVLQHRLHCDEIGSPTAVAAALGRRAIAARAEISPLLPGTVRVRYALPQAAPPVSLIVPTRNGLEVLRICIESLITRTRYPNYELLIVDNGSDDPVTLAYLAALGARYPDTRIRVLRDDRPFNYSQLNNAAVEQATGQLIGLINNDIEVIEGDWLGEMVSHALRPEIGAVGARLLYPDGRIQHAGVIVGFGGIAGSFMRSTTPADSRDAARTLLVQNFTAVTAACMVLRRALFLEVGGFEETHLPVAFNDVDLCLRIRERGHRNLYTPHAVLFHHESATRGSEDGSPEKLMRAQGEMDYLSRRWRTMRFHDPCYSPNLSLYHEHGVYSFPPRLEEF